MLPDATVKLGELDVLLVEDSVYNQKLAIGLLKKQNHRITVADNGAKAVEWVKERPFDLILMDVQMPEMDGLEATRTIRSFEADVGGHMPIVAMTAQAMKGDRERCLEAGMDGYLMKPVRSKDLFQTVADVMANVRREHGQRTTDVWENSQAVTPAPHATEGSADSTHGEGDHDWSTALEAVDGDVDLLVVVMEAFLEESPKWFRNIRTAGETNDAKLLQRTGHTIKSGLRTLGFDDSVDTAFELEERGKQQRWDGVDEIVNRLEVAFESVVPSVKGFIARAAAGEDVRPGATE